MTSQSEIFGASGGGIGLPVCAPAKQYPVLVSGNVFNSNQADMFPGFVGDGDFFIMPGANSDPLAYYNAAGSLQWSRPVGDFAGGNGNTWQGFFFKGVLMYVFVANTAGIPNVFHTETIDATNNIINIGSDQPSNNNHASSAGWTAVNSAAGAHIVVPHPNGTQVIWYGKNTDPESDYLTSNLSDGQFTQDLPTQFVVNSNTEDWDCNFIVTEAGIIFSMLGTSNFTFYVGSSLIFGAARESGLTKYALSQDSRDMMAGIIITSLKPVHYQNDSTGVDVIVYVDQTGPSVPQLPHIFGRIELFDWVTRMYELITGSVAP